MRTGQQAAGGEYIFAPGRADRGGEPVVVEPVAELLHHRQRRGFVREVGNAVETNWLKPMTWKDTTLVHQENPTLI